VQSGSHEVIKPQTCRWQAQTFRVRPLRGLVEAARAFVTRFAALGRRVRCEVLYREMHPRHETSSMNWETSVAEILQTSRCFLVSRAVGPRLFEAAKQIMNHAEPTLIPTIDTWQGKQSLLQYIHCRQLEAAQNLRNYFKIQVDRCSG
jgi:hypothetical protein